MHKLAIVSTDTQAANNSRYILTAYQNNQIPNAEFIVASDNKGAAVLAVGIELGVPCFVTNPSSGDEGLSLRDTLLAQRVEAVLLVGYTKKIKQPMLDAFPERILNFHPAPTPRFGGKGPGGIVAQVAVLKAGARYTGPTIHIVDEEYDHGQILGHWPVCVKPQDTPESLNERCNLAGRRLYVGVINDFIYRLDHPEEF